MTCSDFREALSARLDGEPAPIGAAELHLHLAGCAACRSFEADALRLWVGLRQDPSPVPDLTETIVASTERPRRARREERTLRLGLVMVAGAELLAAAFLFLRQRGYGGEDHAGHESLSFTIAVCIGLGYVAARPRAARAYLPIVGAVVALLGLTAAIDVRAGRAGLLEEIPHVNLLVGFVILWLLARADGPGDRAVRPRSRAPLAPVRSAGLRLVTRGVARLGTAVGAGLLLLVAGAAPAAAHAVLEGSDPTPNTVLAAAPSRVVLTFDEPVTTLPTSLRVFGPSGSRVDDGVVGHPGGSGKEVSVGLERARAAGTYLVSWRVISADSHPVSGAFTFSVGSRSAAPVAPEQRTDRAVALSLGVSRFLGYGGCAVLAGGLAFLALCWRVGWSAARARRLLLAGAVVSLVAAAAALLLKGPYDAALGLGSIGHGDLLRETLSTTYGRGVLARLVIAAIATTALLTGLRGRAAAIVLGVAAVALVATFPVTGHAIAGDQRTLALASDLVHVAAMSTWLGGLVMVTLVLFRADPGEAGGPVARFSNLAICCVLALVATGVYQAWRQVRDWGALTGTTYGRELLVKVGLVAVVVVVAWFSRSWVKGTRSGAGATASRLRRSVAAEVVLALGVLGVTSALVATEPARTAYHPVVAANLRLGPDTVQVSAVPDGNRTMDVHLYLFGSDLQPTDPAEVRADASLEDRGIGPLALSLRKVDVGHLVARLTVPVSGDWILTVRLRTTDFDEFTRTLRLPIR